MKILSAFHNCNIECDCGLEIELSRGEMTECGKCGKVWLYRANVVQKVI